MIIPRITKPYEPGLPALGNDLENKNVGIIGYGRIGKKMAKIYSFFGCSISFYDIVDIEENISSLYTTIFK